MITQNEDIINSIKETLLDVHNNFDKISRSSWSREFFEALIQLGDKKGYVSYTHSAKNNKPGYGEYLVDLIWSKENTETKDGWMNKWPGICMACEIEWETHPEELIFDFQKLTVIKSDIKLFVFQLTTTNEESEFKNLRTILLDSVSDSLLQDNSSFILFASGKNTCQYELISNN